MQVLKFENREEWLFSRRGKITGTRLKDVVSTGGPTKEMMVKELEANKIEYKKTAKKEELDALITPEMRGRLINQLPRKKGFYELIAERLGVPPDDAENQMERGARLEADAVARFSKESGKEVDTSLYIWTRDDNESIAISPDGVISETEAVEAKCLASSRHIEAYLTKQIPDDYRMQAIQYFIVNDKLEVLHFVFFDPRFAMFSSLNQKKVRDIDYFVIEIKREDIQAEVDEYLAYEKETMNQVDEIVNQLTF